MWLLHLSRSAPATNAVKPRLSRIKKNKREDVIIYKILYKYVTGEVLSEAIHSKGLGQTMKYLAALTFELAIYWLNFVVIAPYLAFAYPQNTLCPLTPLITYLEQGSTGQEQRHALGEERQHP